MPDIGSRDDRELIFSAILFVLIILCDIIHDVIYEHVCLTDFIDQAIGQFRKRLALVAAAKSAHSEQHFN